MKPIMFLTPGMSHTPMKISHTSSYCLIKGCTVCYQCSSQEALRESPKTWVVRIWVWACCILVSVERTSADLSVIHMRFYHRSWRARWRRPVWHTSGSWSPAWKCHRLFCQTASRCSPLKKQGTVNIDRWVGI